LWSLVLAGALAASAWSEIRQAQPRLRDASAAGPPPVPLSRRSARELRALPGIGETRALALVEARWQRAPGDPPLILRDLPGIAPALEAAVAAALEAVPAAATRPAERRADSP
jgi:hypothetical protein